MNGITRYSVVVDGVPYDVLVEPLSDPSRSFAPAPPADRPVLAPWVYAQRVSHLPPR